MLIIGTNIMLKSYFGNKGTKELERKLDRYASGGLNSHMLFMNIEDNFYLHSFDGRQGILASIQSSLIGYYENKMLYSIRNNLMSLDMVNKSLARYEKMLITKEKLNIMKKKSNNYIGLDTSINNFYSAKERIESEITNLKKNSVR